MAQSQAESRRPGATRGTPSSQMTIGKLAEKIGLAKSTVSRALSDYPDISPATKRRVAQAAEEYGYRPSSYAQSIRTGLSRSVALILSVSDDTVQRASLADLLDGMSKRLGRDMWTLTVATAADDQSDTDLQRRLIERKSVDGFVIPRLKHDDPRLALMREFDMPFVVYGRADGEADAPFFDIRTEDAMADAVARLAAQGHRRIAYIGTHPGYVMNGLREGGYLAGLARAGLPVDRALIGQGAMTENAGEVAARQLLSLPAPPTAIVCAMDAAALGVYRAARHLGLVIGSDLSVIGYDGISEGAYVTPRLTTYSNDSHRAGETLAELLLARIRGAAPETLRVLADAVLVERESDGPPRASSEDLAARIAAARDPREDS